MAVTPASWAQNKPALPARTGAAIPDVGAAQRQAAAAKKVADANAKKKVAAVKVAKPKAPAKIKPAKATALSKYLAGDTTYQQQLAEFNKSNSDYTTDYNRQSGITNRDYGTTQRQMNLQGQQDRMDQQNDFAGRGILKSGVYAQALGNYNTDFNTKMHNLVQGKTDKLQDLLSQKTSFLRQLQLEKNAAKQDAIRRRAATLGI